MAKKLKQKATFAEFYLVYAHTQKWTVPDFHLDVCDFLDDFGPLGVLMMPRGHGKSTLLEIYNAYRLYKNPEELILAQSATDADSNKTSRAVVQMLEQNPLAWNVQKERGEVKKWWVKGSSDVKHGSVHARGILSNVTGARATYICNDDTEVPDTTGSPEAREKLRYRLSEQIHILIPGGQRLFVGTPHAADSLYANLIEAGANHLVLKMFEKEARFTSGQKEIRTTFKPTYIFSGIGSQAKLLKDFDDYKITKTDTDYLIQFQEQHGLIDCYSEAIWTDRFTSEVMEQRRKECNTLGEWDSQYQMHNKAINEVRLDPDRLIPYTEEITWHKANNQIQMLLGDKRIVSATLKIDPSSGKTKSDVSAAALVLQDEQGRLYWHRSIALKGDVAITDNNGQFTGGQTWQVADLVEEFKLPNLIVESNGIGGYFGTILRSVLKKRNLYCGVIERHESQNKNKRILDAVEAPLLSGFLYAHESVLKLNGQDSPQTKQMRLYDPSITNNEDDYIDSLAGAVSSEPIRIGSHTNYPTYNQNNNWQAHNQYHEMKLDF